MYEMATECGNGEPAGYQEPPPVTQQQQEYPVVSLQSHFGCTSHASFYSRGWPDLHYIDPVVDSRYIELLQHLQAMEYSPGNSVPCMYYDVEGICNLRKCEMKTKLDNAHIIGHFGPDGCWYPQLYPLPPASNQCRDVSDTYHEPPPSVINCHPFTVDSFACNLPQGLSEPQPNQWHEDAGFEGNQIEPFEGTHTQYRPRTPLPFYNYFHHLDIPSETLGRPNLLPTHGKSGNVTIEDLWQQLVQLLFNHLPNRWFIKMAKSRDFFGEYWTVFRDFAKVRFYCETCRDGWTSMRGIVIFYFKLDVVNGQGMIYFKVGGQKCSKCSDPSNFMLPLWYPEEGQKVVTNLFYKVAASCYGLITPKFVKGRRMGQPQAHHNKYLCQGCYHGYCGN